MRSLLAVLLFAATSAYAQSGARPLPPGALPLVDAPPPPPLTDRDTTAQVTTRVEGDQVIEEHRVNGKVHTMRVTPKHGRPYVLMDNKGDGTNSRLDQTLDQQVRAPQWVLAEF